MFSGFWNMKYYEDATPISKQQFQSLLLKDQEANALWLKSRKHMTVAWIAIGAELGFLIWSSNNLSNDESQVGPLIGFIGSAGVAIGFGLSANKLRREAILKYNQNLDVGSIHLGPTRNGMGLVLSF